MLLVGMMGSGKSSLSKRLAERLSAPRLSLDELIVERAGREIPEIFAEEGEAAFRSYESEALAAALEGGPSIIDCGGGVVESAANRRMIIEADADCLYLAAPAEVLAERVRSQQVARPLLDGGGEEGKLAALLERRGVWYQEVADARIDASMERGQVLEAICDRMGL